MQSHKKITPPKNKAEHHSHQHEIDAEIGQLLIKSNLRFLIITICITSLLIYLQTDRNALSSYFPWLGLLSAGYFTHALFSYYQLKKKLRIQDQHWLLYFRLIATTLGAIWGSASIFFFHPNDYLHQTFLAMCLAGMLVGTIVILAIDKYASTCFSVGLMLFFAPPYILSGDSLSITISLIFIVFALHIKLASISFGDTLRENIALRILSNVHKEEIERLAYRDALTNTPN